MKPSMTNVLLALGLVLVATAFPEILAATVEDRPCIGDCDGSGQVTVDELVTGVSLALGTLRLDRCPQFDCDETGSVTVDCIVDAVSAALDGCQVPTTGSPTRDRGTPTP